MGRTSTCFFLVAVVLGLASGCGDAAFDPEAVQDEEGAAVENLGEAESALTRQEMVDIVIYNAYTQGGKPYVYGAAGPDAYDCSGFTYWVYKQAGLSLLLKAKWQWNQGYHWTDKADIWPADLVFFGDGTADTITHVGIYVGDGQYIHAGPPDVHLSSLSDAPNYFGHARYF